MASCRPRRHSIVTLRLTVTPDDVFGHGGTRSPPTSIHSTTSPTLPPRPRSHSRQRYAQSRQAPTSPLRRTPTSPLPRTPPPLCRTPTTPLSRTPTSPMSRTPTSPLCREPSSPMGGRSNTPSPVSPRSASGRHFRYEMWQDQQRLRRRSSLLTVPSTHEPLADIHLRLPRPRSSSIAGPLRPPDLARYLSEASQRHLRHGDDCGSGDVSICSSFDESEQEVDPPSPTGYEPPGGESFSHDLGRTTPSSLVRSGHASPGSFSGYPSHDHHVHDSLRRRNSAEPSATGVCRLRQFTITSRGGVVNRGDSLRPRRSASNTSVTSTVSSCDKERVPSVGSNTSTPGCSKVPTPNPAPQYRVVMIGAVGVGKSTLITQFMTSEYMCAYDDSPGNDESSQERSVSVILEGEEAELVFIRLQDITQAIAREGHADGWVIVYSISDRDSFKEASTTLGRVWSLGHVTQRAVILVANKTDLERTRVVSTTEGRTLAMTYECKFIEVSAGFDHNVDELLVGILTQIRLKQKALAAESSGGPGTPKQEGSPTNTKLKHKNSFRVKGILNKLLSKDRKTKSCENLHVL